MLNLTPAAFQTPTDIANRVLNHLGADHSIDDLLTDISKNQRLILSVFTKLRQAELQRNYWKFAIKHTVIRPISTTTMQWTPPVWDAATTYRIGQVVSYDEGYGSRLWVNLTPASLNIKPSSSATNWDVYCGCLNVDVYDSTASYYAGDVVYEDDGNGNFTLYTSLLNVTTDDPATTEAWSATTTYYKDQIVSYLSVNYIALVDATLGDTPNTSPSQWAVTALTGSLQWVKQAGTLAQLAILYPIGSGPTDQPTTRNVYPLPYGYLRKAPQDPKAGIQSIYGAPTNRAQDDWIIEGNYLTTMDSQPINFRHVTDMCIVPLMNAMFCEGMACRIAVELCEPITQSTEKIRVVGSSYGTFMREARLVNGIENETVEPAEDDWITTRM